ncbi:MAG: 4-hydroxy-tetrahydrodipicolinate synthase [Myxococcota bacterium]|nr:4-hydroxy-tetrahydrodipicolinate synthase [Myxococcota bacterium]
MATALVTPFRDGAVDLAAVQDLAHRQVEAGVHALVPCGTTGEAPTLTSEEWNQVVRVVVEVSAGSVPVVAGCGTNSTASTVVNVELAGSLGVDAVLVVLPYYNRPNPMGLLAHVRAVAAVGVPVVLYHVPGRTGQWVPSPQLAQLCAVEGVVGIKEATGDLSYGVSLLQRVDVPVLSGDDFTFAELIGLGALGVISVLSNLAPRDTVRWYEAARAGDESMLADLSGRLQPVVGYLFGESNPVPVKAALSSMGLCTSEVRLPLAPGVPPAPELLQGLS